MGRDQPYGENGKGRGRRTMADAYARTLIFLLRDVRGGALEGRGRRVAGSPIPA